MIQCIQYRKSTFLGDPEWLTLPWGEKGKDIYQQLYDKGFLLAALLEKVDGAGLTKKNVNINVVFDFLRRLSDLDQELNMWFQDLLQMFSSPLYWHAQATSHSRDAAEAVQPCTLPSFTFCSLLIANTIITYWGLRLVLSNTIALTCQHVLSMTTQLPAQSLPSGSRREVHDLRTMSLQLLEAYTGVNRLELATNIVRSMPYCLNDNMGLIGAQRSIFAMRIALFVLQRHPGEELKRCQAMYLELNTRKGLNYAREIGKLEGRFSAAGQEKPLCL